MATIDTRLDAVFRSFLFLYFPATDLKITKRLGVAPFLNANPNQEDARSSGRLPSGGSGRLPSGGSGSARTPSEVSGRYVEETKESRSWKVAHLPSPSAGPARSPAAGSGRPRPSAPALEPHLQQELDLRVQGKLSTKLQELQQQ